MCLWSLVKSVMPPTCGWQLRGYTSVFRVWTLFKSTSLWPQTLQKAACYTDAHSPGYSVNDPTLDNCPQRTTVCHSRAVSVSPTGHMRWALVFTQSWSSLLRSELYHHRHLTVHYSHHPKEREIPHWTVVTLISSSPQPLATTSPTFCLYEFASSGWCGPFSILMNSQASSQSGYNP